MTTIFRTCHKNWTISTKLSEMSRLSCNMITLTKAFGICHKKATNLPPKVPPLCLNPNLSCNMITLSKNLSPLQCTVSQPQFDMITLSRVLESVTTVSQPQFVSLHPSPLSAHQGAPRLYLHLSQANTSTKKTQKHRDKHKYKDDDEDKIIQPLFTEPFSPGAPRLQYSRKVYWKILHCRL